MKNTWRNWVSVVALVLLVGGGTYWYVVSQDSAGSWSARTNISATLVRNGEGPGGVGCYYKNDKSVLLDSNIVKDADVDSFEDISVFEVCLGKDKNHVYEKGQVLKGADPATFALLWYSKPGPFMFFANGSKIVKYTVLDRTSQKATLSDVEGGDPNSFKEILGGYDFAPWGKDKNNVYCQGNRIVGADPQTAKLQQDYRKLEVRVQGILKTYDSACSISS